VSRSSQKTVGLGICGLGRAFTLMLPTFVGDNRFVLVAATTPNRETRDIFNKDFDAPSYPDLTALCTDPNVDAVYIASPHEFHFEHVEIAARAGKHILVEKPLAISLKEAQAIVDIVRDCGVHLIVGPSHSFDAPVLQARQMIASNEFGGLGMIQAMYYTDFLYRPRRPEELDTSRGGGVVFSQAAHQVDIIRLLGGGLIKSVRAHTGNWDEARSTEGAYNAQLAFEGGAFASLTYSGYAHFDGDELVGGIGELGRRKDPDQYGNARRTLSRGIDAQIESEKKRARNYGLAGTAEDFAKMPSVDTHEHFGLIIASCQNADLKLMPDGVTIYGDQERRHIPVPVPTIPRVEVMDELFKAVVEGKPPLHSAAWGMATLEACVAILTSARENREVELELQVGV
jgi:phthalate 4,5-cis-dihydrodiol dehydrogenase